jgi:hypothetical protein
MLPLSTASRGGRKTSGVSTAGLCICVAGGPGVRDLPGRPATATKSVFCSVCTEGLRTGHSSTRSRQRRVTASTRCESYNVSVYLNVCRKVTYGACLQAEAFWARSHCLGLGLDHLVHGPGRDGGRTRSCWNIFLKIGSGKKIVVCVLWES